MLQHKYSMSPLAWLEQRASVMRPTVFPDFEDTREAAREAGFPMTVSVGHTFVTKPSMLLECLGYHDDLQRVHEYKRC